MQKKILFFINTLSAGGAERVLIDVANNMDKTKYQITVQTLVDGGAFRKDLCADVNYKSIIRVKNDFIKKVIIYVLSFVIPAKIVHRLFIGSNYDYECAFLEGVPTKIIGASGNKRSKKLAWVHTDICKNLEFEKIFRTNDRQIDCYKKYDRIICVSKGVEEAFKSLCGNFKNVAVMYNVINDKNVRKCAGKQEEKNEERIVAVGRLERQKGYDRLLEVHKKLREEGFKYKLIFVGDGSERNVLKSYVKENFLEDSTEFLGYCHNPYKYMSSADLLVFPSRVEGFCTAICEGILLGKAVVATDCCGTREILGDSEFGLVTENNKESIYEGVKKMLSCKEIRMEYEKKALLRATMFSLEKGLQELEKLFE